MPSNVSTDLSQVADRPRTGKYSSAQLDEFAERFRQDGFVILPQHFPSEKLATWNDTFLALMQERIAKGTASARGPQRYYISLPFTPPFADPAIFEDPDILYILRSVGGPDLVMPELATDTPLNGSEYQVIHRDFPQRSPDMPELDAAEPFQFAVNFPLCDTTRENGPFEIARGTHLLTDARSNEMVKSGEAERALEPLFMKRGDVMVRDVRALHRGTPNTTDTPRVMVVVGYNRSQHKRPQLRIFVPRATFEKLSEQAQQLLGVNPIVDSLDEASNEELYSNLYFLDESEAKADS
jgi:hypothetical protein